MGGLCSQAIVGNMLFMLCAKFKNGSIINLHIYLVDIMSWMAEYQLREALISEGCFGDPALDMAVLLVTAFEEFKRWRRGKSIPCSQKTFRPRNLVKKHHGYYLTLKAYNSRIVLLWLADKCSSVSMNDPGNLKLRLHASALILDELDYSCLFRLMTLK